MNLVMLVTILGVLYVSIKQVALTALTTMGLMGLMGLVGLMGLMGLLLNVKMFVQKEHVILPQMLLNRNAKNATIATMLLMPRVTIMLMPPPQAIQAPIQT